MSYYLEVVGKAIVKEKYREDFDLYIAKGDWKNVKSQELKEIGACGIEPCSYFTSLCNDSIFDKLTGILEFNFSYNIYSDSDCIETMYGSLFPIIFHEIIEYKSWGEDYWEGDHTDACNKVDLIEADIKEEIEYIDSYCPEDGQIDYYKSEYELAMSGFFAKWVTASDVKRYISKMNEDEASYNHRISEMVNRIKRAHKEYLEKYYDKEIRGESVE